MKAEKANARDTVFWESLEILEDQHWISGSFRGRGHFGFAGNLRFGGDWCGELTAETPDSHLYILRSAKVSGRVQVAKVSVEGELNDVEIDAETVHVLAGARIRGTVRAAKLIIDEGAMVEGRIVSRVSEARHQSLVRGPAQRDAPG